MTTYYILLDRVNNLGPSETIYSSTVFDKETLQKIFDTTLYTLKKGDMLEYMKEDAYAFHPAMLLVEKTTYGFITWSARGHQRIYHPKYKKNGASIHHSNRQLQ